MKRFYALLVILVICSSFALANESPAQTLSKKSDPDPITSVNKTLLLQLVNAVRSKGCTCGNNHYGPALPLVWNDQLEKAAAGHSMDMYKKNYFSHIESDGSNGGVRIENAGYTWKAYGENIGMGYTKEKEVIDGWIKSPMHCTNIMNPAYKEMAVGRAGTYWTQDFATK